MSLVLKDRVRETTATVGTGAIALSGAVTGYQSFSTVGDGSTTYYTLAGGSQWEVGIGTYNSAGNTLSRDTVLASSNAGALVNFTAGTKDIFVTYPAEKSVNLDTNDVANTPKGLQIENASGTPMRVGFDATGNIDSLVIGDGLTGTTAGVGNFALGNFILNDPTFTGTQNICIGGYNMEAATTASQNTYIGNGSGDSTTTGGGNVGVGFSSLISNVSGTANTGLGTGALYNLNTGSYNISIGYGSGSAIDGGNYNVIIGSYDGTDAPVSVSGSNYVVLSDGAGNVRQTINGSGALSFDAGTSYGTSGQALTSSGSGSPPIWASVGSVTSVSGTGSVSGLSLSGTVTGSGSLTLGGTLDLSSPPAIGGTTPNTGKFSTLTTTGAWTGAAISDPAAPASNNLAVYAKNFGGYTTLAARNALNSNFGLQAALWQKSFMLFYTQSGATAPVWLGAGGTTVSVTPANVTATVGSTLYQTIKRASWTNAVTTINQSLGTVTTANYFFRGSVAGQGGFFYFARFGFDTWTNGGRLFAGMTSTGTTSVTTDPSSNNNCVGFCVDAADNGAISFLTRGTAATKASTGLTIVTNKGYDCYIYCAPNSSQYTWQIIDINTGSSVTGTATLNLPTNTQVQAPAVLASNAALTTAGAVVLSISKAYVETDY